jgi:hypothetical protein
MEKQKSFQTKVMMHRDTECVCAALARFLRDYITVYDEMTHRNARYPSFTLVNTMYPLIC